MSELDIMKTNLHSKNEVSRSRFLQHVAMLNVVSATAFLSVTHRYCVKTN